MQHSQLGPQPVPPPVPAVSTAKGQLSTSPLQDAVAQRQSLGPWKYDKPFASARGLVCYLSFPSSLYFFLSEKLS